MKTKDIIKFPCSRCGVFDWKIGTATTLTGSIIHPYYCGGCGDYIQQYAKKSVAAKFGTGKEIELSSRKYMETRHCVVCGAEGAEIHHFAPRFLFGAEEDRWPTAYLCTKCHLRWHNVVTPNMSKKPGCSSCG